jgi:hypothetical protein
LALLAALAVQSPLRAKANVSRLPTSYRPDEPRVALAPHLVVPRWTDKNQKLLLAFFLVGVLLAQPTSER